MLINIETEKQGAEHWISQSNAYSLNFLEEYRGNDFEKIEEITPITRGDIVWCDELDDNVEVIEIDKYGLVAKVEPQREMEIEPLIYDVPVNTLYNEETGNLPTWGTLWEFPEDSYWIEENLQKVADLGFRIYQIYEENMILLGIDGGGYDFYGEHWIPLYKARGFTWHM